jgi:hypothetical protein
MLTERPVDRSQSVPEIATARFQAAPAIDPDDTVAFMGLCSVKIAMSHQPLSED